MPPEASDVPNENSLGSAEGDVPNENSLGSAEGPDASIPVSALPSDAPVVSPSGLQRSLTNKSLRNSANSLATLNTLAQVDPGDNKKRVLKHLEKYYKDTHFTRQTSDEQQRQWGTLASLL
eukprot:Skav221868  [mRNA]  locus=scaffold1395:54429:59478:+ [translate_table: standard]